MQILETAARHLEAIGVKHAPEQAPGHRYVTLEDPRGTYYILGTDNMAERESGAHLGVQIVFMGVPAQVNEIARKIGFAVIESGPLSCTDPLVTCWSAILVPRESLN